MDHAAHGFLAAIEQSALGLTIRDAVLLYPLANVVHVLAVMGFFAAVAVMDAALLGWLRGTDPCAVIARFRPVAWGAFGLVAASGLVLFVPEAAAIGMNLAFQAKLALIALAGLNLWIAGRALAGQGGAIPGLARRAAGLSLVAWLLVAAVGRFIAYA